TPEHFLSKISEPTVTRSEHRPTTLINYSHVSGEQHG
ncbi:thioesterase, partial [Vibrio anguillarum]|nr:thioesterase [Vibrio anguillarum]